MLISVATATYFMLPFEQTLEIIAQAGFQSVELDLFWERKHWAMAQHLRGYDPRHVVQLIDQAQLKVSSIHDGGGVLEDSSSACGYINPRLREYLDHLGYAPDCLVFHTPHIEGELDEVWWQGFAGKIIAALEPYRHACRSMTVENMPTFDGYTVPLITPEQLLAFACQANLGITLDTSHYAQIGVDIVQAANILTGKVATVHLSDFLQGKAHVFIGEGEFDLPAFLGVLDSSVLQSVTLECAGMFPGEQIEQMGMPDLVERLRTARLRLEGWLKDLNLV